ncbi:MAG: type II secretion system protein [Candidatus Gracilibacteria bacterium]|nr:type II secretion system protein [Candidatus Gracilibacteria bacterium]
MEINKIKAFTLVELIVVITILAILGTIAFINLQGYSTSARDGKRISDINNIMKKIGIESSKGTSLSSLITTTKTNTGLTIDGNNTSISIQGIANFQTLKEDGNSFKDPITNGDYVLSYSVGGTGTGAYKFTQASTVNEELNQAVVKGNYYLMQVGDSPSITIKSVGSTDYYVVDEGVDLPYEIVEGTTPPPVVNSCDTQPNYTNASFITGIPTSENQIWQDTNNANPCYYECTNGYTGSDCGTPPPLSCPTGFILVPGSPTFSTSDFCVAQYEMKNVGGVATSQAASTPWTSINQPNSIIACNNLGAGYHLITNNEWMTIARNIEANSVNWANGIVGSLVSAGGGLYRGNVTLNDSASCGINTVLDGVTAGTNCVVGSRNKRMHILSNGNEIWDISGNVWEHVNGTNNISSTTGEVTNGNACGNTARHSWNNVNDGFTSCTFTNTTPTFYSKANHGPNGDYNVSNGIGRIYSSTTSNIVFIRGSSWDGNVYASVYALALDNNSTNAFASIGFRCAYTN